MTTEKLVNDAVISLLAAQAVLHANGIGKVERKHRNFVKTLPQFCSTVARDNCYENKPVGTFVVQVQLPSSLERLR